MSKSQESWTKIQAHRNKSPSLAGLLEANNVLRQSHVVAMPARKGGKAQKVFLQSKHEPASASIAC